MNPYDPNSYIQLADDAAMVQAAVDAAAKCGAAVTIPRFNLRTGQEVWDFPRSVRLHSGSTIILDNCHIRQADNSFDNIFKNDICREEAASDARNRQHDIRICGLGHAVLDGGRHNGLTEYNYKEKNGPHIFCNCVIHFHNVERFVVDNVTIREQRYWGMTFHYCAEGRITNIVLDASGRLHNQDGIDLRMGCHDILIENIMGYSGDDVVALTNLNDCGGTMKVEGLDNSIHDVIIRNIQAAGREQRGIVRLLNHYGKKLYNIIIENVIDISKPGDSFRDGSAVRIGELAYVKNESDMARFGDTYNITIRNICARTRHGVFISRTLENALIDNVQMHGDGGTTLLFRAGEYRNIRVRNLTFSAECDTPETDDNPSESAFNGRAIPDQPVHLNRAYAVYFQGPQIRNLSFDGITAGKSLDGVFGGYGDVKFKARDIFLQNPDIPVMDVEDGVIGDIRD